ncbi:MAG: kelch repeat-containing protein [Phycisphaerae bacterium]
MNRTRVVIALWLSACVPGYGARAQCVWEGGLPFPVTERKGAAGVKDPFGTLVVLGGRPFSGAMAPVHYLPFGDTAWQTGQPLEQSLMNPAAGITPLGQIMVASGWIQDNSGGLGFFPLLDGLLYDLNAGVVGNTAALAAGRGRAFHGFTSDDQLRLYLVGGIRNDDVVVDLVDRYDGLTDQWTVLNPLPAPRYDTAVAYDGQGRVLAIGGRCCSEAGGTPRNNVYALDIATGRWLEIAPHPGALSGQSAALGADGRVYVVGGTTGSGAVASVYIHDPGTGIWSTGPSLQQPRFGAAIALGNDGYLNVMGGNLSGAIGTNTVERLNTNPPLSDCNSNGTPDQCEPDCNQNGIPDDCDITDLTSSDCNANAKPDECEISVASPAPGGPFFCTVNCDPDCNQNGIPDACDISGGLSPDVNVNGVPDECDQCVSDADCTDPDPCNGTETCNVDTCVSGVPVNCDDNNPCTTDACDPTGVCQHTAVSDGVSCGDGAFCNGDETCQGGNCTSGTPPCPAGPCDACDDVADVCRHCVFDLDLDPAGVIGTGDFGMFSACFGRGYLPADARYAECLPANFDGVMDPATGEYIVGTGDFGAFSGCFAMACVSCAACFP